MLRGSDDPHVSLTVGHDDVHETVLGLIAMRFAAPIFFGNAQTLSAAIRQAVQDARTRCTPSSSTWRASPTSTSPGPRPWPKGTAVAAGQVHHVRLLAGAAGTAGQPRANAPVAGTPRLRDQPRRGGGAADLTCHTMRAPGNRTVNSVCPARCCDRAVVGPDHRRTMASPRPVEPAWREWSCPHARTVRRPPTGARRDARPVVDHPHDRGAVLGGE